MYMFMYSYMYISAALLAHPLAKLQNLRRLGAGLNEHVPHPQRRRLRGRRSVGNLAAAVN